jgi:transposase-like protein
MRRDSSLTEQQRARVVALFEEGHGPWAVATELAVSRDAVAALSDRWRIHGGAALVPKATKRTFSFEVKRDVVQRLLAGETKLSLAQEFGIASPKTIQAWARTYRAEGEDGLRPKPKGRPRLVPGTPVPEPGELERLRQENERLRAEVAYLGKLRALRAPTRR